MKHLGRTTTAIALGALAIAATTALAGSGAGSVFNLGQTNTVNATSTLTGAVAGPQLTVKNTSTGTSATGLNLNVTSGRPPFTVNSTTKVVSLNADLLDGKDSTYFLPTTGTAANSSKLGGLAPNAFWKTTGNAGTTAGTNFLGTTDNQPLELKVNGQRALRLQPGSTSPSLIGGFSGNLVQAGAHGVTISGGGETSSANVVSDDFGAIGGGEQNVAGDKDMAADPQSARFATVAGGQANQASALWAAVAGGDMNTATATGATVAGGVTDHATALEAAVGGGASNTAGGLQAVVGGGNSNTASGDTSTVAGGGGNYAFGLNATVAGGASNTAGAEAATVSGGESGSSSGSYASIGGGNLNTASGTRATIAGGSQNTASGGYSSIGGGQFNAAALFSSVPGGYNNAASGQYAFAAGQRAKATQNGSFVWGDTTAADLTSPAADTFTVRAAGGMWLGTNSSPIDPEGQGTPLFIATSTGASLTNAGVWTDNSDRALKHEFRPLNTRSVLQRVARMPITSWSYKAERPSIRHIGPMAQDFYSAFGLGYDNKHIGTIDEGGVALAAIQGLYRQNQALRRQNSSLNARLARLERTVEHLAASRQ